MLCLLKAGTGEVVREGQNRMPQSSHYKQHRENLVNGK
jgi:hypothetical protein